MLPSLSTTQIGDNADEDVAEGFLERLQERQGEADTYLEPARI